MATELYLWHVQNYDNIVSARVFYNQHRLKLCCKQFLQERVAGDSDVVTCDCVERDIDIAIATLLHLTTNQRMRATCKKHLNKNRLKTHNLSSRKVSKHSIGSTKNISYYLFFSTFTCGYLNLSHQSWGFLIFISMTNVLLIALRRTKKI